MSSSRCLTWSIFMSYEILVSKEHYVGMKDDIRAGKLK